jgi:hypothetical protein
VSSLHAAAFGAALLTRVAEASLGPIAADNITRNAADAGAALLTRRDADPAEAAADMTIRNAAGAVAALLTRGAEAHVAARAWKLLLRRWRTRPSLAANPCWALVTTFAAVAPIGVQVDACPTTVGLA